MFNFINDIFDKYVEFKKEADPRTKDWFLLNDSPIYVWILTLIYLLFVLIVPHVMKNRKPFGLEGFMFFYNIGLVALSIYMFVEIILSSIDANYGFLCAPYNEETRKNIKELRVTNVLWWYFFSKAIELMDTVLMLLRKKNNQVTFLHVFHHATMLNIWWWVMTFIPGGLSCHGSCLNCMVHFVMYSYYGLSVVPSLKGKLWWKKYITMFQLLQFCITFTHTSLTWYLGCDFPSWGQFLLSGYMVIMLTLFANFYMHAYLKRERSQSSKNINKIGNGNVNIKNEMNGHDSDLRKRFQNIN